MGFSVTYFIEHENNLLVAVLKMIRDTSLSPCRYPRRFQHLLNMICYCDMLINLIQKTKVDSPGIEPGSHACKASVLPLDYEPQKTLTVSFVNFPLGTECNFFNCLRRKLQKPQTLISARMGFLSFL